MLVYYKANGFVWYYKFLMHWSVQFIIYQGVKCFCGSILASSCRSFTVSCCFLIWLLSDIASSEGLSGYTNIFRCRVGDQFPGKCVSSTWIALALLALVIMRPWFIYSKNIWKRLSFLLSFNSISNHNFIIFLPEIGDFFCNSWNVTLFSMSNLKGVGLLMKKAFKHTEMVYYDHSSLMI